MSELYRTQNYMVLNFSGYNKESALKKEKVAYKLCGGPRTVEL